MVRLAFGLAGTLVITQSPNSDLLIAPADLARQLRDPSVVVLHVADREASFEDSRRPVCALQRYRG
jgi:hypothetical protein